MKDAFLLTQHKKRQDACSESQKQFANLEDDPRLGKLEGKTLEQAFLLRVLSDSIFLELDARHGAQVRDDPHQVVRGVQLPPASRVAAGISQSLRVSPDTVVRGGETPAAVLLALDDLLADVAHRRREGSRVAAPYHQGVGLAGVAQMRALST